MWDCFLKIFFSHGHMHLIEYTAQGVFLCVLNLAKLVRNRLYWVCTHSRVCWVNTRLCVGGTAAITHCVEHASDGLWETAASVACTLAVGGSRADLVPNPPCTYRVVTFACRAVETLVSLVSEEDGERGGRKERCVMFAN